MALKTSAAAWAIRVVKTGEQTETLAISAVLFVLAIACGLIITDIEKRCKRKIRRKRDGETWMITGVTGFLGPRVEVTLRGKGEVEVLPMTREELNFTDEEQVKRVLGTLHPDVLVHAAAVSDTGSARAGPGRQLEGQRHRRGVSLQGLPGKWNEAHFRKLRPGLYGIGSTDAPQGGRDSDTGQRLRQGKTGSREDCGELVSRGREFKADLDV